jgi:hypothetical protein
MSDGFLIEIYENAYEDEPVNRRLEYSIGDAVLTAAEEVDALTDAAPRLEFGAGDHDALFELHPVGDNGTVVVSKHGKPELDHVAIGPDGAWGRGVDDSNALRNLAGALHKRATAPRDPETDGPATVRVKQARVRGFEGVTDGEVEAEEVERTTVLDVPAYILDDVRRSMESANVKAGEAMAYGEIVSDSFLDSDD